MKVFGGFWFYVLVGFGVTVHLGSQGFGPWHAVGRGLTWPITAGELVARLALMFDLIKG